MPLDASWLGILPPYSLPKQPHWRRHVTPMSWFWLVGKTFRSRTLLWISRNAIDKLGVKMFQRCLCEVPGQRQARVFIKERMPDFTRDLLQRDWTATRILVGLFTRQLGSTGKCSLKNWRNEENFCLEGDETAEQAKSTISLAACLNLPT